MAPSCSTKKLFNVVWFCDDFTSNKKYATLLVLRPNNARIGQPCSRSFKGHVVSRGLNLSRCCARCRAKKASQIIFKVVCLQSFFLSMIGRRD